MDFKSILLAQKTGYIPRNHFDALFARRTGGAVLKDFPGLPASIVTVTDALAMPLNSLKVAITPVQSGSGDPSPDNIRPISGWTGAKVFVRGENLFDKGAKNTANGYVANNYLANNGVVTYNASYDVSEYIPIKSATYTISALSGYNQSIVFYDREKAFISGTSYNNRYTFTFTCPQNTAYIRISVLKENANKTQLKHNTTSTSYSPYTGTTYPITFPSEAGTVYGGTLDVTNGTLTVDRKIKVFKGEQSENWNKSKSGNMFYLTLDNTTFPYVENRADYNMANEYKFKGFTGAQYFNFLNDGEYLLYRVYPGVATREIAVKNLSISTVEDFKSALASNNLQIVYEITPITYQLTPTEVQMLLGTNNIWADTGDILEGKYYAKK